MGQQEAAEPFALCGGGVGSVWNMEEGAGETGLHCPGAGDGGCGVGVGDAEERKKLVGKQFSRQHRHPAAGEGPGPLKKCTGKLEERGSKIINST